MLLPGNQVEKYVVEAKLGEGGMAEVLKVRHLHLGSVHAMKVLSPELAAHEQLRQRFLAEGQIQATLIHPNIVRVTDIVAQPGVAGLVLDYVEGASLEALLERQGGPLPQATAIELFLQILAGVGHAHRHGVVHRDLKPSNVLLQRREDGGWTPRIADFGIAKVAQESGAAKRPTATGTRMGTPHYMSPEQVRSPKDVTPASDVFSLGVLLYELVTGTRPFDEPSEFDTMAKVVSGAFVPPERVAPGLPAGLSAAIRKALQVAPQDRFQSCEQFAAALRQTAESEATSPRSPAAAAPDPDADVDAGLRDSYRALLLRLIATRAQPRGLASDYKPDPDEVAWLESKLAKARERRESHERSLREAPGLGRAIGLAVLGVAGVWLAIFLNRVLGVFDSETVQRLSIPAGIAMAVFCFVAALTQGRNERARLETVLREAVDAEAKAAKALADLARSPALPSR